jgi:putative PIN family toxin of toxin-antitoxin system
MVPKSNPRVFLDSNVIFSGLYSPHGAPGIILKHFIRGKISVAISQQVLEEVIRTIREKLPAAIPALKRLLLNAPPEIVADPEPEEIEHWTKNLSVEDAAIWAAAIATKPDYFITGDNHFFKNPDLAKVAALKIVTPAQFLKLLERGET